MEMRLVVKGSHDQTVPDISLVRLMARAHAVRDRLFRGTNITVGELALKEDLSESYVTRLLRLAFLAADIVGRILAGRHPPELTAARLMADTRLPLAWNEQRLKLGFA